MKLKKRWTSLLLIFALLISVMFPVAASAATNKAMKVKVSYSGKKTPEYSYMLNTDFTGKTKLSKKSVAYGTVYIPKSVFKNGKGTLGFIFAFHIDSGKYSGYISANDTVYVKYKNKKASLYAKDADTGEKLKASKYATLKTEGKYLVLKFKTVYRNTYNSEQEQKIVKINTKLKYSVSTALLIVGEEGKVKGNIYLDEVSLKTKTWSSKKVVTFNNSKNYSNCSSSRTDGKDSKDNLKPVKIK